MQAYSTEPKTRLSGMYYGWRMVAIGAVISGVGSIHQAALSVFFLPLTRELNLSHATLSFVFSLSRLEGSVESPLVGWMIDRFGPRLPILIGTFMGGVGYLFLAMTNSFWPFVIIYMGIISIGFQMGFISSMHAVANLWFIRYRTRAMSAFSSSLRLGSALFTPVMALIVAAYSWRIGSLFAAVVVLLIAGPLSLLIRRSPESMGLLPDGDKPQEQSVTQPQPQEPNATQSQVEETVSASIASGPVIVDFTLKESLRTPSYWLIVMSTTVRYLVIGGIHLHWVPIFVWKGYSEVAGATFIGFSALVATPLILLNGYLGDRFSKRLVLMSGHSALLASMFILIYAENTWLMYVFATMFAYGEGVSPTNYSIIGEYFGRRIFARLRGLLTTFTTVAIFSPVYAGWVYDRTQDYTPALFTYAGIAAFGIFVLLFLVKPRKIAQVDSSS